MKLRTKLFLTWSLLAVLLWAGVFWVVEQTVQSSFARSARQSFAATHVALDGLQREQGRRMSQVALLLMQVPELRALIAEHSYELESQYSQSLEERLDHLSGVVEADFVCAIDQQAMLIGASARAPWREPGTFATYAQTHPPALRMIQQLYGVAPAAHDDDIEQGLTGLWVHEGRLFQIVAVPLIFQQNEDGTRGPIEGALLIGSPLTDAMALGLARSQSCQVSFITENGVTASSLQPSQQKTLALMIDDTPALAEATFVTQFGGESYLTTREPLTDPRSGVRVGELVIQRSLSDSQALLNALLTRMLWIIGVGLTLAGMGSYLLSGAITRPINRMLEGVHRVGEGDLDHVIPVTGSDELAELAGAFNDMVSQVRQRTGLEHQMIQVETAARTKSEFLASMSHEIRTPMTAILGYADLLRDPHVSPEERLNYVNIVRRHGQHLLSIINDILDLSKIESNRMKIEVIPCSPNAVLSDVMSLMRVRATEKKLGLEVKVEGAIPRTIHSDPTRIRQILINLVGNAIKFTEAGSVRICVSMTQVEGGRSLMQFQVIDSGLGMTEDQMARIFEPFSQADASTTRRFGGTGLGLSICRRLSEMLGGQISVDSKPKLGSIFTVTIDPGAIDGVPTVECFQETVEDENEREVEEAPTSLRGRVLLVEDSDDNRRLLGLHLRNAGLTVEEAENGLIACEKALAAEPCFDVVLMDMQMPVMDGFTAVARLRKQNYTGTILALTANVMPEDEARSRDAGCDGYLSKPIARDTLLRAVAEHLDATQQTGAATVEEDETIAAVRDSYVASLPQRVHQLRTLLEADKLDELAKLLHAMKGSGGMFGFMSITEQASAAEQAIHDERAIEAVTSQVRELIEQIRGVKGYDRARESAAKP